MKIEIEIDSTEEEKEMTFSNNDLNNYNFVEMRIEGIDDEFTISVSDLEAIVAALKKEQKNKS